MPLRHIHTYLNSREFKARQQTNVPMIVHVLYGDRSFLPLPLAPLSDYMEENKDNKLLSQPGATSTCILYENKTYLQILHLPCVCSMFQAQHAYPSISLGGLAYIMHHRLIQLSFLTLLAGCSATLTATAIKGTHEAQEYYCQGQTGVELKSHYEHTVPLRRD